MTKRRKTPKQKARVRRLAKAAAAPKRMRIKYRRVPVSLPVAHDEEWVTRDGRKIPIWQMDEDHVRNALRMLIRAARKRELEARRTVQERFADGVAARLGMNFSPHGRVGIGEDDEDIMGDGQ